MTKKYKWVISVFFIALLMLPYVAEAARVVGGVNRGNVTVIRNPGVRSPVVAPGRFYNNGRYYNYYYNGRYYNYYHNGIYYRYYVNGQYYNYYNNGQYYN